MSLIHNVFRGVVDFCYPPLCLHCREWMNEERTHFCAKCQENFFWIHPKERCQKCLQEKGESGLFCIKCPVVSSPFYRVGAVFDYLGPAETLVKKMKRLSFLGEKAGAFLFLQMMRLNFPTPDFIIPVPMSWDRLLLRGFNQSKALGKGLSDFLKCPVLNALKRTPGDFSQAGLNREQRKKLAGQNFSLKTNINLEGKTLLVVDDVWTTGTTMLHSANALLEGAPACIYGLTLCCA